MINCYFGGEIDARCAGGLSAISVENNSNIVNCYNSGILRGEGNGFYYSVGGIFSNINNTDSCNIVNTCSLRSNK